jgi:hypothetical protein
MKKEKTSMKEECNYVILKRSMRPTKNLSADDRFFALLRMTESGLSPQNVEGFEL